MYWKSCNVKGHFRRFFVVLWCGAQSILDQDLPARLTLFMTHSGALEGCCSPDCPGTCCNLSLYQKALHILARLCNSQACVAECHIHFLGKSGDGGTPLLQLVRFVSHGMFDSPRILPARARTCAQKSSSKEGKLSDKDADHKARTKGAEDVGRMVATTFGSRSA